MNDQPYSSREVVGLLHRRHLAVLRHRRAVARSLGLSETEAEALCRIVGGSLTPSALGDLLDLTSGGVTALIQRLEGHGHVLRRPNPVDRRSTVLQPTPRAIASLARRQAVVSAQLLDVTLRLSDAELEAVGRFLEAVSAVQDAHMRRTGDDSDDHGARSEDSADLWH